MAFNHFDYVPSSVTDDRSGFKFFKPVSKGIQIGWLYPMCKPIVMLPGSSLTLDVAMEIRSGALIAPLQDELIMDLYAFNVPNRIVWEHWKQFLGSVDDVLFDNLTEYHIPSFLYGLGAVDDNDTDLGAFESGMENYQWNQCLACHFELPYPNHDDTHVDESGDATYSDYEKVKISALPFRGYNFIYNEFFTPEYINWRILFSKADDGYTGENMRPCLGLTGGLTRFSGAHCPYPDTMGSTNVSVGGVVLPTFRAHRSLWTSCLPKPSLETLNLLGGITAPVGLIPNSSGTTSSAISPTLASGESVVSGTFKTFTLNGSGGITGLYTSPVVADLNQALLTVNNYRETILLQNYYDALNRSGSRYDEILANLFHTRTAMAIISIPELIVHKRFTIYRKEVVSTAQTNNGSDTVKPLGSQASYIDTVIRDNFFTKSTTEHGYIHLLMTVRPAFIRMTSGFEPDWMVFDKLDLFYQQFQGMGDVPRKKMEVAYGFLSSDDQTAILGYQEYSAEYKYQRASAVGWLDPHTPNPITGFNIVDNYKGTTNVGLNFFWLSCASEEVSFANCLAISDPTVAPQLICDIRLSGTIYHPMKVYNIPGQGDLL